MIIITVTEGAPTLPPTPGNKNPLKSSGDRRFRGSLALSPVGDLFEEEAGGGAVHEIPLFHFKYPAPSSYSVLALSPVQLHGLQL